MHVFLRHGNELADHATARAEQDIFPLSGGGPSSSSSRRPSTAFFWNTGLPEFVPKKLLFAKSRTAPNPLNTTFFCSSDQAEWAPPGGQKIFMKRPTHRPSLRTFFDEDDPQPLTDQAKDAKTDPVEKEDFEKPPPLPPWANTEGYGVAKVDKESDFYTLDDIEDPQYACRIEDFKPAPAHPKLSVKKEFLDAHPDFKNNIYYYKVQMGVAKDGAVDAEHLLWDAIYPVGRFKELHLSSSMFAVDGKRMTYWGMCPDKAKDKESFVLTVEAQDKRGKALPEWTAEGGKTTLTVEKGKQGKTHPKGEVPKEGEKGAETAEKGAEATPAAGKATGAEAAPAAEKAKGAPAGKAKGATAGTFKA